MPNQNSKKSPRLFLFGGYERTLNQVEEHFTIISKLVKDLGIKEVLFVPYARTNNSELIVSTFNQFKDILKKSGITLILHSIEFEKDNIKTIYLWGGNSSDNLFKKCREEKLNNLILNCDYLIGDSAGSMIMCDYYRNDNQGISKGLGLIKQTIVEPHYTIRDREEALQNSMKLPGIKYGIGIDSMTGIEYVSNDKVQNVKYGSGEVIYLKN